MECSRASWLEASVRAVECSRAACAYLGRVDRGQSSDRVSCLGLGWNEASVEYLDTHLHRTVLKFQTTSDSHATTLISPKQTVLKFTEIDHSNMDQRILGKQRERESCY